MNIVFWGRERQNDTTVHMMAVAAMLYLLGEPIKLCAAGFVSPDSGMLGICECKAGLSAQKRHFLWDSDLVVVCLQQKKSCVDAFFAENFHLAKNIVFLLGGYACEEGIDAAYLERIYRVAPEQLVVIPYSNGFRQALKRRRCEAFLKKELKSPTSGAEEQFVHSVRIAAIRILHRLDAMDYTIGAKRA